MTFLDYNATTPLDGRVLAAMTPFLADTWYNPSSFGTASKKVRLALEEARAQVASFLGGKPQEVVFTSGATESINTVLRTAKVAGMGILSSNTEHSAAFEPLQAWEKEGGRVGWVEVDQQGQVNFEALEKALASGNFGLLNVIWANNETGVLQDFERICEVSRQAGVLVHTDAVQAAGKMSLRQHRADYLSISGHKINGPKGVGALLVRGTCALAPLIVGGGQEQNRRGGTENVAAIIGLAKACELAMDRLEKGEWERVAELRDRLQEGLLERIPGAWVNGAESPRIANTLSLTLPGCQAEGLLILLEERGLVASAGSACSTGKLEPSRVLTAMGLSRLDAKCTLRFSLSHQTREEDIDAALVHLPAAVAKLRSVQSSVAGSVLVYSPEKDRK